jgi:uncharacterized membrane protein
MHFFYLATAIIHALASAAWFGSMFYSFFVLHPRAKKFFATDDEQFEQFIATVAQGARWKVLGAFAVVAVSGVLLVLLGRPQPAPPLWIGCVVAKVICLLIALAVFCYASWRLWPARIFATPDELPGLRKSFRRVAIVLLTLIAAASVLGIVMRG